MDDKVAFETGAAAGGAAIKYGLATKLLALFGASAVGAAFIAWYQPQTRAQWWSHGLGAGVGGMFFGGIIVKFIAQRYPEFAPPQQPTLDELLDWVTTYALPVGFVFGGLFWGLVGALRNAQSWIAQRGFSALRKKVGL